MMEVRKQKDALLEWTQRWLYTENTRNTCLDFVSHTLDFSMSTNRAPNCHWGILEHVRVRVHEQTEVRGKAIEIDKRLEYKVTRKHRRVVENPDITGKSN